MKKYKFKFKMDETIKTLQPLQTVPAVELNMLLQQLIDDAKQIDPSIVKIKVTFNSRIVGNVELTYS